MHLRAAVTHRSHLVPSKTKYDVGIINTYGSQDFNSHINNSIFFLSVKRIMCKYLSPQKSKIVYFRDLVGHCQGARIQGVTFNDVVDLMTPWQCLEDQKPFRYSGGGGRGESCRSWMATLPWNEFSQKGVGAIFLKPK